MDSMTDLLVLVVYCLGVYTLLGVVAGLYEWGEARLRRTQRGLTKYTAVSRGRPHVDSEHAPDNPTTFPEFTTPNPDTQKASFS